jgi:hypothetical protein
LLTQITRFGTAPDSRPGDQIAEHIGGYSQVTGMTAGHGA